MWFSERGGIHLKFFFLILIVLLLTGWKHYPRSKPFPRIPSHDAKLLPHSAQGAFLPDIQLWGPLQSDSSKNSLTQLFFSFLMRSFA